MNRYMVIGIILNVLVMIWYPFAERIIKSKKKKAIIISNLMMTLATSIGALFCIVGIVLYIVERW